MTCKNCDQPIEGNYCSHCGQSTKVDKINFSNFITDFTDSVFQVNHGLFFSIKELFLRPGYSIKDYLNGKRKNHIKPIAYALTLSTIYFIFSQVFESTTIADDFIIGFSNFSEVKGSNQEDLKILQWFADNYAYTTLLLLPIFSLGSYLSFKNAKYNYLEHLVLNAYIAGQQAIFYSVSSTFSLVPSENDFLVSLPLMAASLYTFYVYWQFFSERSRLSVVLRTILSYIIYLGLLITLMNSLKFALS